jgi:benzoate/toluate 1,2-dioxygenase beta subunit
VTVDPREVEQFLYREARLADDHAVEAWLDLWTPGDDTRYWIPGPGESQPGDRVAVVFDDFARLSERMTRLTLPGVHAQEPRSSLRRMISNVELLGEDTDTATIRVGSNFVIHEVRRGERLHVGRSEHWLRRCDGRLGIHSKHVFLNNRDVSIPTLAFIL